jgi:hypothetical protein
VAGRRSPSTRSLPSRRAQLRSRSTAVRPSGDRRPTGRAPERSTAARTGRRTKALRRRGSANPRDGGQPSARGDGRPRSGGNDLLRLLDQRA